ncbi:mitochondrial 18 KDa protein-domain-containing protein [Pseudoneurospora amorphoporcata]|uniref:Mitochondrial fission process protein 1 n=1 Tax=Pseudoneurospora amorphoporcata TaxID=241081 RepID=A0AAN6NJ99_9PEZI|nr:mitochondrial 18 KDa protein-domain-containing protein [Pseudoneurospora amorphoporcata]
MWPFGSSNNSDKPAPPQPSPREAGPLQDTVEKKVVDVKNAVHDEFDPKKLPPREKLPDRLQKIVDGTDKEENFYDDLVEGYAPPSTDSNVRYAAYAARFRTILLSAHRYVAYTSDIGESFRPVAHPWLVRGAYGVSWAYILGDVSYEGYKAYWHNARVLDPNIELTSRQQRILGLIDENGNKKLEDDKPTPGKITPLEDYRTVMLQRGIFQSVASMGLPAFTIHSVVRYSGRALKDVKNKTIRTWGPIGLGLAVVPFLPTLFDKPVENAVEWIFHKGFETFGGKEAVGHAPLIGRERTLSEKPTLPKEKRE